MVVSLCRRQSHLTCLKRDHVNGFHRHLNSIKPNIQFTLELGDTEGQGLPFLDTITTRSDTQIQVNVDSKPTHTDHYLDFHSHHPLCHKTSVVNTLLRRARNIPSTLEGKREEAKRVKAVLRENNYPSSFINSCERALSDPPTTTITSNGFVVLPHVRGISKRIGRVLRQQQVKVADKPQITINSLFPRPKAQTHADRPQLGIVHKISCTNCDFVYYGQTERELKTRIAEHKKAVSLFHPNSNVACRVHENSHHMDFSNVKVVGHEANFQENENEKAGNDHIAIPVVDKSLARA